MSALPATRHFDWRTVLLAVVVALAGLPLAAMGTPRTAPSGLLDLPEAAAFTYDTAASRYDPSVNHALQVGDHHAPSTALDRPTAGASGRSFALSGELSAPRAPLRLSVSETWGNPNTLARHFRDHGADFAARNADEYANMASDFFQRSQLNRLPTRIDADGVIRVYDPATNTFGAFNPSGTTRTFFTPKRGIDYWYDQPGTSPWGP